MKILIPIALLLTLTGCGASDTRPPAEIDNRVSTITSWCDEYGNRVYTRDRYPDALAVSPQDPSCKTP